MKPTEDEEVIRTFRYRLYPNRTQATTLDGWLGACCSLYNACLEQRRDAYRRQRVSLSYMDQTRQLTELRASDPEWRAIPVEAERFAIRSLDRAFQAFFRRVKARQTPGFPRFKGRGWYDTISMPAGKDEVRVEGHKVRIPKLGLVNFRKHRELCGEIREARITRKNGRWWVSFACDVGVAPSKKPVASSVGVDVGISSFATLSTGEKIENPRFFKVGAEVLASRQRSLARKRKGCKRRRAAKLLVGRAQEHVANQRLDHARKMACDLFARFDLVAYEDLNVKGLAQGTFAKSIHDVGWSVFTQALASKAENAGKWAIAVDPRKTSIVCSACGIDVRKALSDRVHHCECGLTMDRDENAARNILERGRRSLQVEQSPN